MTFENVVLILAILCFSVQMIFWGIFLAKMKKHPPAEENLNLDIPVSIVICARNEAEKLRNNLPRILLQDYPTYEVILVNHASTDDTISIAKELQQQFENLQYIECENPRHSKRPALIKGLERSTYNHILVTDADCFPSSSQWINRMMRPFTFGYEVVVAAAPLYGDLNLITCFAGYDAAIIYLQYGTATLSGMSYMGVGRNMGYLKDLYLAYSQNTSVQYIGGDDDLFISGNRTQKIALVTDEEAMMWSETPKSWKDLYRKKRRHVSVSWAYTLNQKIYLFLFSASHWGLLLFSITLMGTRYFLWGLFLLVTKCLLSYYIVKKIAKPFVVNFSIIHCLITELVYLVHYPILALYLLKKPPKKW